jgi:hypothetical protein
MPEPPVAAVSYAQPLRGVRRGAADSSGGEERGGLLVSVVVRAVPFSAGVGRGTRSAGHRAPAAAASN